MVGAVRFELTTSCTPSKRASQTTLRPDRKPCPTQRSSGANHISETREHNPEFGIRIACARDGSDNPLQRPSCRFQPSEINFPLRKIGLLAVEHDDIADPHDEMASGALGKLRRENLLLILKSENLTFTSS